MEARQERGLVIAATSKIEKNKLGWKVPSQSGNGTYIVNLDHGEPFCSCPWSVPGAEALAQEPGQQIGEFFTYLFVDRVPTHLKDV